MESTVTAFLSGEEVRVGVERARFNDAASCSSEVSQSIALFGCTAFGVSLDLKKQNSALRGEGFEDAIFQTHTKENLSAKGSGVRHFLIFFFCGAVEQLASVVLPFKSH